MTQFIKEEIDASWPYFTQYWLMPQPIWLKPSVTLRLDKGENQRARRRYFNAALSLIQKVYRLSYQEIFALIALRFLQEDPPVNLLDYDEEDIITIMSGAILSLGPEGGVAFDLFSSAAQYVFRECRMILNAIVAANEYEAFERWQTVCRELIRKYPNLQTRKALNAMENEVVPQLLSEASSDMLSQRMFTNTTRTSLLDELRSALSTVQETAGKGFSPDDILTPYLIDQLKMCLAGQRFAVGLQGMKIMSAFNPSLRVFFSRE